MKPSVRSALLPLTTVFLVILGAGQSQAQQQDKCVFLCRPELKFEPTFTIGNLFSPAIVAEIENGQPGLPSQEERESKFELVFALGIPTELPRVGLAVELIWAPFEGTSSNVFTGGTASGLGVKEISDNPAEFEFEFQLTLLEPEQTGGWVDMHFDIVDQFSPSKRPQDTSTYTHKLNFELDTAVLILHWLPQENWLRNLEFEVSLDYLATGLPRAGDEVPLGEKIFLTDASPWSLSLLAVIPIAPLWP